MDKNITLIGMMGCGKTTVGKALSDLLAGYKYVDIDEEIEKSTGKKISEIFLKYGEKHFRNLEKDKIKKVFSNSQQIIATGGGAFELEENRNVIFENSSVIYLKTSPEEIYKRIKNEFHRPLLAKNFSLQRINDIIKEREKNYLKAAYIVETDNKKPVDIAEEILGVL